MQAHHLLPADVRAAPNLSEVLAQIDRRIREGALLVHQAALDVAFLRRGYARTGMRWPDPPVVDTVALLIKAAKRARFVDPDAADREPELNLMRARRRLQLPDYGQHDALTDAISAAELFLVLRRRIGARSLRDVR
jgi:DNA polymerase-3 subunit epsilon